MVREGSVTRDLDALLPLVTPRHADRIGFVTDDRLPHDLLEEGAVDVLVRRAIAAGVDPVYAVRCASWNTARHYLLPRRGAVAPGYFADLLVIDDLAAFRVARVLRHGRWVAEEGRLTEAAERALGDAAAAADRRPGGREPAVQRAPARPGRRRPAHARARGRAPRARAPAVAGAGRHRGDDRRPQGRGGRGGGRSRARPAQARLRPPSRPSRARDGHRPRPGAGPRPAPRRAGEQRRARPPQPHAGRRRRRRDAPRGAARRRARRRLRGRRRRARGGRARPTGRRAGHRRAARAGGGRPRRTRRRGEVAGRQRLGRLHDALVPRSRGDPGAAGDRPRVGRRRRGGAAGGERRSHCA
jgi:hypothetical protein